VDAYFWLKTPGESDGCTQILPEGGTCPRFDADCGSGDALGSRAGEPRSPEAGRWFDYQVKELAANANFEPPPAGTLPPRPPPTPPPTLPPNNGNDRITTTTLAGHGGGGGGDDHGTCSAAFGQCGGKHWNGPTCCQSGCRCRHEGEWYSQCEPPAGNHMCSGTIIFEEQVPIVKGGGSVGSSYVVVAGVTTMFVMVALAAVKLGKQQQQQQQQRSTDETDMEAVE